MKMTEKYSPEKLVEIFGEQNDDTKCLWPSGRRLDSLARLLEASSLCCSISCYNKKFYISTNTITKNSLTTGERNAEVRLIELIMSYFSDLTKKASEKISNRAEVFYQIVFQSLKCSIKDNIHVASGSDGKKIVKEIVQTILANPDILKKEFAENIYKKHKNSKRDRKDILFAYAVASYLYKAFHKIEISIDIRKNEETSKNARAIDREYFDALKELKYQILFRDDNGVHAEMRLLGKIIEDIMLENFPEVYIGLGKFPEKKEVYIGLSKRCCFKCHFTLDSANEILAKQNIVLKFKGYHDLWHKTWNFPSNLQFGGNCFNNLRAETLLLDENPPLDRQIKSYLSIAFHSWIAEKRIELSKNSEKLEEEIVYHNMNSESSHSGNSELYEEMDTLDILERKLSFQLKEILKKSIFLDKFKKEIEILEFGLCLCGDGDFREMFEFEEADKILDRNVAGKQFANLLFKGINQNCLFMFLTTKNLCGEVVYNKFGNLGFDQLKINKNEFEQWQKDFNYSEILACSIDFFQEPLIYGNKLRL